MSGSVPAGMREPERPDPDRLLAKLQSDEQRARRGRLKVWLGACPGVGKTFAMLSAARRLRAQGQDVVIGMVESHGRVETQQLAEGLEILPRRAVEYRGTRLEEFDLDGALARKPAIVLVDELAHTNAPGSRYEKRWQDVQALLAARIDVHTTLNVQHVESLNDVVARVTGVTVRETVPDAVLDDADEVEVIDLAPDVLLERLRGGKVYLPEAARAAREAFFKPGNVAALRELALRKTAQLVDRRRREDRQAEGARRVRSTSERVLVCVGPSPFSARLVRAAHRMAAVVRGELIAVWVAPYGAQLAAADHERVLQNIALAESLGARAVTIEGADAAAAIVDFAVSHEISRIVVGKTRRSRWHEVLFGSFTMDVIRNSRDIDVYVIHGEPDGDAPGRTEVAGPVRTRPRTSLREYRDALLSTAAALLVAWMLYSPPDLSVEALVLILGVVVTALRCGRWPSLLGALVSALAFDFLFTEPRFTFAIADPAYLVAFVVMAVVGVVLSSLVAAVRDRADAARAREAEVTALHSLTRELADAQTVEEVGHTTIAHLRDVVRGDLVLLVPPRPGAIDLGDLVATHGATDWLGPDELAVARWCWDHGKPAGASTGNLPGTHGLFVPVRSGRGKEAVLGLSPRREGDLPAPKQRLLIETFAEQAALALQRLGLAEERLRARQEAETERLRSTLLASVSHDLRTPLATITGSASSLLDPDAQLDPVARRELLAGIATEAQRLNELIANLVFATRLESGAVALRAQWTSAEEVVGSALHRARDSLQQHVVLVEAEPGLPLLQADPVLLEQAVFLLLDNAARHTPAGTRVQVRAFAQGNELVVEIADNGPGIPDDEHARVFRRFERGKHSSGMGLGLPICAAICRAHGGVAMLLPDAGHGAVFQLRLPLPQQPPPAPPEASADGERAP